jgi:hypothetical protein
VDSSAVPHRGRLGLYFTEWIAALSGGLLIAVSGGCAGPDAKLDRGESRLQLVEEVRFRATDQAEPFTDRAFVLAAEDGTTYIGDFMQAHFLIYAPDGKFLQLLGRRGKGPGEFVSLVYGGLWGDTLWAFDPFGERVTYFVHANVTGTETVKKPSVPFKYGPHPESFRLADSTFVWITPRRSEEKKYAPDTDPVEFDIIRYDRDAKPRNTVATYTCTREALLAKSATGVTIADMPFNDCDLTSADPGGKFLYNVSGLTPTNPDSARFTVARWSVKEGAVLWKKSFPFTPRKLTKGYADSAAFTRLLSASPKGNVNPVTQSALGDGILRLRFHPAAYRAITSMDGTLYLERERSSQKSAWMMIGPDGTATGTLELTPGNKILFANGPLIWVMDKDAEGQPEIVRYRIGTSKQ